MGTQHVHRVVVKKNLLQRGCTTIEEYRKLGSTNQWLPAQPCTTVVKWNRMHVETQHSQTVCMWVSIIIRRVIMFCHMRSSAYVLYLYVCMCVCAYVRVYVYVCMCVYKCCVQEW